MPLQTASNENYTNLTWFTHMDVAQGNQHSKHSSYSGVPLMLRRKRGGKGAVSEEVNKAWNKYAKYTTVGDGRGLWKAAAQDLAAYAAQVKHLAVMSC